MPNQADRFHVIAIDVPGQGHSERPDISYDTHAVAAHVDAAVKAPGVSTYWLVAHDIGAWVAFPSPWQGTSFPDEQPDAVAAALTGFITESDWPWPTSTGVR